MEKHRVDTDRLSSKAYTDLKQAEIKYERTKHEYLGYGVNKDSYVQLVCSENDFEDYTVINRAVVMTVDFWAKWQDVKTQ